MMLKRRYPNAVGCLRISMMKFLPYVATCTFAADPTFHIPEPFQCRACVHALMQNLPLPYPLIIMNVRTLVSAQIVMQRLCIDSWQSTGSWSKYIRAAWTRIAEIFQSTGRADQRRQSLHAPVVPACLGIELRRMRKYRIETLVLALLVV